MTVATLTAQDVIAQLRADLTPAIIGVFLCTIGGGLIAFALLGGIRKNADIICAGLFAAAYGFRLLLNLGLTDLLTGKPGWLPYLRSDLEYLVPIPFAFLFSGFIFSTFDKRLWKAAKWAIGLAFSLCAAIAIPYEAIVGRPFAATWVVNALIGITVPVFISSVLWLEPSPDDRGRRQVAIAALIFGLFVINEHTHLIRSAPFGLASEPVGFLIFILTFARVLMRRAIVDQRRLDAVDGELETARRIQLSILPQRAPDVDSLQIASRYIPASEVAGDFFDFLDVGDGRVGLLIADVSGHGVPAALVASMLKIALAAQNAQAGQPARLLIELNALFCGKLERQFITAAYVCVDPASRTITFASAGHPPPILRSRTNQTTELRAKGIVLGRFRDAAFEEGSVRFEPGDTLLLYTDGVTEARDRIETSWGEDRLRALVSSATDASAEALASAVVDEVTRWSQRGRFEDDVTLVVVHFVRSELPPHPPSAPSPPLKSAGAKALESDV